MQGISADWDMWAMQSGGTTNFEVLRAATLVENSASIVVVGRTTVICATFAVTTPQ